MSPLAEAAKRLSTRRAVTLNQLAREAGMSRATLHRRYGSAEAVIAALRAEGVQLPDKPSQIFDAVLRVIELRGLAGLTVDAVARHAEVSPATLYRRYRDRSGLLRAFIRARSGRAAARFELTTDHPPEEVLGRVAELVLRSAKQNAPVLRAALTAPPAERALFESVRTAERGTGVALTRYFERLARQGRLARDSDAARLTRCFLVLLLTEAGVFEARTRGGDVAAQAAFLTRLFWRGAAAGERP